MKNRLILIVFIFCLSFIDVSFVKADKRVSPYPDLFDEIVNIVEENFYNPEQIVQDFPAIKARFRPKLATISSKESFSKIVNNMLHMLNASHTYYLTPDDYEYYQLTALFSRIPDVASLFGGKEVMYPTIGILTQVIENQVFVVSVLSGSVAEKAGILKGDEILSINGKPFKPIASLQSRIGLDTFIDIKRWKQKKSIKIKVRPVLVNPKKELLDAQKSSVQIIKRKGVQIGYIHLYSYAGEEYHQELMNAMVWGALKKADALIIDMRYGLGGAWPYYLNIFNPNIPQLVTRDRKGRETVVDSQWRKPAVYLVNSFSRSGKELLVFGARKYNLATVIGERTPGHTLGGRLFPLSNGDALFLAIQSCLIDGVNLEGVGVSPDIEIPFDIRYCAGDDVQLDKALEYLVEQLIVSPLS